MASAPDSPPSPPDEEVDIWWGGPAVWSMLPSFLVCIAATVASIGLAIYLTNEFDLPADPVRYAVYAVGTVLWTIQSLRWGMRMVGTNYRVTTRRIYCWTGLRSAPGPPIELAAVSRAHVEQSWLERLLGVGRVRIVSHEGELTLSGLTQPRRIAAIVEHCAKEAKQR